MGAEAAQNLLNLLQQMMVYIIINIYFFFPPIVSQLQELHGITYNICVHSAAVREVVSWFLHVVLKLFLFWGNSYEK